VGRGSRNPAAYQLTEAQLRTCLPVRLTSEKDRLHFLENNIKRIAERIKYGEDMGVISTCAALLLLLKLCNTPDTIFLEG
jgi:hypothetical protein